jgi:hypothetical protein
LGDGVIVLGKHDPPPTRGLLIISPLLLVMPVGDEVEVPAAYKDLQRFESDAEIGHSLLVYDLDRLADQWPSDSTAGRGR